MEQSLCFTTVGISSMMAPDDAALAPSRGAKALDAILVIPDAPLQSIDFGIDTITYETGSKFKGLSMIPRGLHLVYYSTGMGSRQGFFFNAMKGEVVVRPWDARNEEISARNTLNEEQHRALLQALARGDLNANLGPYPTSQHHSWINLSNFISNQVLSRADIPTDVLVFPGDEDDILSIDKAIASARRKKGGVAVVNGDNSSNCQALKPFFPDLARVPRFSDILTTELKVRDRVARDDNMLKELASLLLDKSKVLHVLVKSYFDDSWDDLLGELQLSFVLMMFLYSYPAMEHWKRLVSVVCCCESILVADTNFTINFIRILYSQLKFIPEDFFENELSKDNFMRSSLTSLFSNLNTNSISEDLKEHRKRLMSFIRKRFGLFEGGNMTIYRPLVGGSGTVGELALSPHEGLDSSDLTYNLIEEDMPTIVDDDDLGGVEFRIEEHLSVGGNVFANIYPPLQSAPPHASHWGVIDSALGIIAGGAAAMEEEEEEEEEGNVDLSTGGASSGQQGVTVSSPPHPSDGRGDMTRGQVEAALFSWRYPALYEEMCQQAGREDMIMTAARLLDTPADDSGGAVYFEAKMYLEMEVGRQK